MSERFASLFSQRNVSVLAVARLGRMGMIQAQHMQDDANASFDSAGDEALLSSAIPIALTSVLLRKAPYGK